MQQGRNKGNLDQHPWGSFRLGPSLTDCMAHCSCRGDTPHLHRPALRHIALPSVFTTASATASQHRPILPVRKESLLMTAFKDLPWACDSPCAHTPHLNDQVLTHGTFTAASATDFSLYTNALLPASLAPTRVSRVTVIPFLALHPSPAQQGIDGWPGQARSWPQVPLPCNCAQNLVCLHQMPPHPSPAPQRVGAQPERAHDCLYVVTQTLVHW